nr:hypothetical protein [Vibrio metschnikovii]
MAKKRTPMNKIKEVLRLKYDCGLSNRSIASCLEAKKLQGKGKTGKADVALAKIQKLYALESRLKLASVEERWAERQAQARKNHEHSRK